MLTIAPPPVARRCRPAARLTFQTARTLRSKTCCHSSSVASQAGLWKQTPALLTTMSRPPSASTAASTARSTSSSTVRSALIPYASTPSPASRPAAALLASSPRPTNATVAPQSASARAKAYPRPRLPPVTRAFFPSSEKAARPRGKVFSAAAVMPHSLAGIAGPGEVSGAGGSGDRGRRAGGVDPVGEQVLRGRVAAAQAGQDVVVGDPVERDVPHPLHRLADRGGELGRPADPVEGPYRVVVPV